MADDKTEEKAHPLVGVPDGHTDENGEKIVYEYDDDGKFLGWHKESA